MLIFFFFFFFLQKLTLYFYFYFYQIPLKPQPRVLFLNKNALIISKCSPCYRPYRQETTRKETKIKRQENMEDHGAETVDCLMLIKP